jgi:ABC-type uncharacterized transport system fused permease/ATPase subunit
MTVGTLRDQVIYPHEWDDMKRRGIRDADLEEILSKVWLQICCHESFCSLVSSWFVVFSAACEVKFVISLYL